MTIEFQCAACGKPLRVRDDLAGRRGKCPQCGNSVDVPWAAAVADAGAGENVAAPETRRAAAPRQAATTPPVDPLAGRVGAAAPSGSVVAPAPAASKAGAPSYDQLRQQIPAAFHGPIEPVRVPITYRLAIVVVALLMVLLPLIYIALIGLVGYGVYYHAVNHTGMFESARGRGAIMVLLVYLAPMVCGAILVLFMIKPLFARPAKEGRRRSLTREGEPLLFDFVDRVCEAVGAPRPRRIDLDCEVNASASFRRGMLSFLGSDLVLTIGMPLVAGLTTRQLAGVLAHEFGHFSQGAGMRLSYVIRSIVHWFQRVVYERDRWDEWLHVTARSIDLRIGWVLFLTQLFVWLTRKILFVLMLIGHVVAGYLLRQMEFDADRYEARLAGSNTFESTCRRLTVLQVATRGAHADLGDFYAEGRLGDNMPKLIEANVGQIPKKLMDRINQSIDESTTGWFDTHPSDRERIANARAENAPGIFQVELPARVLFRDFDAAARNVTWDYYSGIFGAELKPQDLHPIDALLQRQQAEQRAGGALGRYFQGEFQLSRPYPLPALQPVEGDAARASARALRDARQVMLAGLPGYQERSKKRGKLLEQFVQARQVLQLLDTGILPGASDFEVPVDSIGAQQALTRVREQLRQLDAELAGWDLLATQRIAPAMSLLFCDGIAGKIADVAAHRHRVTRLWPACQALLASSSQRLMLQFEFANLAILVPHLEAQGENRIFVDALLKQMEVVMNGLNTMRERFQAVPYPLDHVEADITIGKFLLTEPLVEKENLGEIYQSAEQLLDRHGTLSGKVAAQIAQAAEAVETAIGLPPLPEPADADDDEEEPDA